MNKVKYQVKLNNGEVYITSSFNDAVKKSRDNHGVIKQVFEYIPEELPEDYGKNLKFKKYREKFSFA
jgi:hypothetical protein